MKIALIGAGMMGAGLARLFGGIGWPVAVWDRDADALARVDGRHATGLADAVADADLVIEAVAERADIKAAVFADLAAATGPATILATNSSVIAVGTVTAALAEADAARVCGMHFWNPPDLIPLVEVIAGPRTARATIEAALALLTAAGREPVEVRADVVPGNRLQHALWREAIALVDEGVCTAEDVDRIVKRSFGARLAVLGPLENADLVGLALTRDIHRVVLPTLSRATAPSPGLDRRIEAGTTFHVHADPAATRARLAAHLARAFP